jgi:hypothetical protein
VLAVLSAVACGAGASKPAPEPRAEPEPRPAVTGKADLIRVDAPLPGALVRSPLLVSGVARGRWYFEANFPVTLLDANGRELAQGYAQAEGEWMTEEFVPFTGELRFAPPSSPEGALRFEKANPSGLSEHADEVTIPVRFAPPR